MIFLCRSKDPGSLTLVPTLGGMFFERALLDLGASINVMPKSIYEKLDIGELRERGMLVQLANLRTTKPCGIVEDVIVQVEDLLYPPSFYVLEMGADTGDNIQLLFIG